MKVVAFTRPEVFTSLSDASISYPYQRVVALWHNDGFFGEHIGEKTTPRLMQRELELGPELGYRLMASFRDICVGGERVNCHRFSRKMAAMAPGFDEPRTTPRGLQRVDSLTLGAVGLVGAENFGVPHSIGYGMGDEGLQAMSSFGEVGFAKNADILNFYRRVYPKADIGLYELANQA